MADFGSLRSDLNYWNSQANSLDNKIKKLKRRRSDVEDLKSALQSTSGSNSNDVNHKIRQAAQRLESAIEHSGKEGQLDGIFADKSEQPVGGDGNLSAADSEIRQELNDINRQLGEAESNLAQAQGKVRDLKAAIASEERREREEAAQDTANVSKE